jgi:adenine C2-methylase RlmN of 23S rRNA A2503 and tRNA A37
MTQAARSQSPMLFRLHFQVSTNSWEESKKYRRNMQEEHGKMVRNLGTIIVKVAVRKKKDRDANCKGKSQVVVSPLKRGTL